MPGRTSGHPALRRLVAVDVAAFADRTWGREPLLSPADRLPEGFGDLLSAAAVDELVSERGLRTPFLRVAKDGSTLGERAFTAPGGVGALIADQVAANYRKADLTAKQRAMLDFALKVSRRAEETEEADREALRVLGWTDEDIWDIAAISSFFALSNRMANFLAMRPNDEFYTLGR